MSWQSEVQGLVDECVDTFGRTVTLRRGVRGAFDAATQTREADGYSATLTVIRRRLGQGGDGTYPTADTVYRGKVADLPAGLGPEPQLASGMYVEDSSDGSLVRRRVVRVELEGDGTGFALYCTTDRSPSL